MRLLFLPVYTNKNLNGCTSYNTGQKLVRQAVEENDDWFVHWYLPSLETGKRFRYDGKPTPLEEHPKVHAHKSDMYEEQYVEIGFVPQDLYDTYSQHCGKYHVDAVLTERPASAWYMRKLLHHPFSKRSADKKKWIGTTPAIPTFIRDPFVKTERLHAINEDEEIAQTLGYLTSYNIFFSEYDKNIAIESAKKYINFGQIRRMIKNSIVVPPGTDTKELDKIKENSKKRDTFTILIAERLKNGTTMSILDASDYMVARGYDVDVVVSSQTAFNGITMKNYPTLFEHAEKYPSNPREKYLPLAAECHVTISMPHTHSYPQGLMEQLYLGIIAVLPDLPWVDTVLPNYPFKVARGNMKEMVATVKWIKENYEEAKEMVAWIPDYIRENYDSQVCNQKMLDFIKEKTEEELAVSPIMNGYRDLVQAIPSDKDYICEKELLEFVRKESDSGLRFNDPKKTLAFGNYKSSLFRVMKDEGWKELYEGPLVTFKR